jgi:hypothetical protein
MVLRDAPASDLVECEDVLQDAKRMFYFFSYSRLDGVLPSGLLVDILFELRPAAGHILGVGRGVADHFCLALVAAVAPDLVIPAMQQVGQHVLVGH